MIAFLIRLLFVTIIFSLVLWVVRVVGVFFRRQQLRRGSAPRGPRAEAPPRKKHAEIPPDDVIDVPYKDVS